MSSNLATPAPRLDVVPAREHAGQPADAAVRRHRVVIIGCGFGGLFAAKTLRRADAEITVIDRTNHHLFQPLPLRKSGLPVSKRRRSVECSRNGRASSSIRAGRVRVEPDCTIPGHPEVFAISATACGDSARA